jgi:hypothetical protein
MANRFFSPFWVTVSIIISVILIAVLYPLLLEKYGMAKAILLSLLIPVAMGLAYIRGWLIAIKLAQKREYRKQVGA